MTLSTLRTAPESLGSVLDMVADGGPLMIPLAAASVVALAFTVERALRLRDGELGSERYGRAILAAYESGGRRAALEACD